MRGNFSIIHKTAAVAFITTAFAFVSPSSADTPSELQLTPFQKCMSAVVKGPTRKKLYIHSHTFNCKPVRDGKKLRNGNWAFFGHFSHHLSLRPDDQVSFRYELDRNLNLLPHTIKVGFKRGGFRTLPKAFSRALLPSRLHVLAAYVPDIPFLDGPAVFGKPVRLKGSAYPDWEDVAHWLVAEMIVNKTAAFKLKLRRTDKTRTNTTVRARRGSGTSARIAPPPNNRGVVPANRTRLVVRDHRAAVN